MSRNENVWTDAKCAALRVEFLTSREELFLYAKNKKVRELFD